MDPVENFIEHYGVKGMHWGVRRSRAERSMSRLHQPKSGSKPPWHSPPPKKAPVISTKPVKGLFSKRKHPKVISEEARELHAIRMKAKQHGLHSLTNKELETVNKRLELQSKYNKAHPKKKNPLVDLVLDTVLSDYGSAHIKKVMTDKNASDNMIKLVEAAITINRGVRKK